jgi:O-antigen ligase
MRVKAAIATTSVLIVLIITFIYADKITGGKLALRYQGETYGTLAGRKQKTLNVITSNRLQIFKDDLNLWKEYPVFGVGVGASRYMRNKTNGFLSHVEFSRLLSEHGIPGLVYIVILTVLGINVFRDRKQGRYSLILFAFYGIALFTTFHSAMRTYITPLLFGLSMLLVRDTDLEESAEYDQH